MKKFLTCIIAVVFVFTLAFLGASCKEEAVEEAVEEEGVEEAVEEEAVEEEVVAEEALTFTHVNASDPADPFISKISVGWNEACDALGVTSNEQFAYNDIAKIIDYTNAIQRFSNRKGIPQFFSQFQAILAVS